MPYVKILGEEVLRPTTLEFFKPKANPATQKLEPSKWIEYALLD